MYEASAASNHRNIKLNKNKKGVERELLPLSGSLPAKLPDFDPDPASILPLDLWIEAASVHTRLPLWIGTNFVPFFCLWSVVGLWFARLLLTSNWFWICGPFAAMVVLMCLPSSDLSRFVLMCSVKIVSWVRISMGSWFDRLRTHISYLTLY